VVKKTEEQYILKSLDKYCGHKLFIEKENNLTRNANFNFNNKLRVFIIFFNQQNWEHSKKYNNHVSLTVASNDST